MSETKVEGRTGADWLVRESTPDEVFTPERLTDEHRLVAQTAAEFVAQEVAPALEALEGKDWQVARSLVSRAGALGLIGTDVPERFGGVGLDKVAAIVVGEAVGGAASFATTFGAQTGLVIVPILCFGTADQQARYLPRITSGEWVGAYCLSESGSGSDALGARTRATRLADGSWSLTGEKLWITNGGFADVFVVFAKVDGDAFSAFIVERGFPGVTTGKEEHKLGLRGSSTTPLVLQDARVPAANLLGEVGKGAKIAFNVLNYGRFKLAAMCSGGAKATIAEATTYALGRRQFGQPIATFGAIRQKLADMTIQTYATESMLYRTAGLIDRAIADRHDDAGVVAAALEEFAVEASLLKVAASEAVDFVVDENVQIHGGNGFVGDYPAERRFRDARVNRIFEGTNEINRLLVPGLVTKRAAQGRLALGAAARGVQAALVAPAVAERPGTDEDGPRRTAAAIKQAALLAMGVAMERHGERLAAEQEIVMLLSDLAIEVFASESAALRASAAGATRQAAVHRAVADVFVHDAGLRAESLARTVLSASAEGDALRTALAGVRRLLKVPATNTVAARRVVADEVAGAKGYPF
jgi:alkylation response protein AidB-like acyl-CoA dehydrogenase